MKRSVCQIIIIVLFFVSSCSNLLILGEEDKTVSEIVLAEAEGAQSEPPQTGNENAEDSSFPGDGLTLYTLTLLGGLAGISAVSCRKRFRS